MKSIELDHKNTLFSQFSIKIVILTQYSYLMRKTKLGNFDSLFQILNPFWNDVLAGSPDTEQ